MQHPQDAGQQARLQPFFSARHALAGLGLVACSFTAQAQSAAPPSSSVTVFGTVDVNLNYSRAGGKTGKAMDQGGNQLPSRLGFRGSEDLGDGWSASFWLEHAFHPDTGGTEVVFWHRRTTLSLASKAYGELRLGRDYVPTFWNMSQFAPFGTVGVGGSSNIVTDYPLGLGGTRTLVRANNAVGYFLPRSLGGLYGQAMVSAAEGSNGAHYTGARLGYAQGAFDVAVSYGQTPVGDDKAKVSSVGGSYQLGDVKLMGFWMKQDAAAQRQVNWLVGADWRTSFGNLRASWAQADRQGGGGDADDAHQFSIGYLYSLSKRTALYTAYGRIANKGQSIYVTGDTSPEATPGGLASGLQVGMSHQF